MLVDASSRKQDYALEWRIRTFLNSQHCSQIVKSTCEGAIEMIQRLQILAVLVEDLILRTHMVVLTIHIQGIEDLMPSSHLCEHQAHTWSTYTGKTVT